METVAVDQFGARDARGLIAFLEYCRRRSRQMGEACVASISLRVRDLDPLAVLRSIQEPDEPHLYMERSPVSVSGAEAVARCNLGGADRFEKATGFVKSWSDRIIATGDLDGWFSGPLFFHAFAFSEKAQPSATLFIPRWQVCRTEMECIAVANVRVEPSSDLRVEAERILRAHQTFSDLAYKKADEKAEMPNLSEAMPEDPDLFLKRVEKALKGIESGDFEKIVLSRWTDLQGDAPLRPLELLRVLRERFPDCYSFSFSRGNRASWIGATPECLIRIVDGRFETEALAGSAPRGKDLSEDTEFGAELLSSEKDLREHAVVAEWIQKTLAAAGLEVQAGRFPHLLRLSNVQHLRTPISGSIPPDQSLLRIAGMLHPTPAVGGNPPGKALERIADWEAYDRGLYTGFLGWEKPSGEGQSVVALRTGRVEGSKARLFAGAGIVAGSDPLCELRETQIKLEALSRVICGE